MGERLPQAVERKVALPQQRFDLVEVGLRRAAHGDIGDPRLIHTSINIELSTEPVKPRRRLALPTVSSADERTGPHAAA